MPKSKERGHRVTVYLDEPAYQTLMSNVMSSMISENSVSTYGSISYTVNKALNYWSENHGEM